MGFLQKYKTFEILKIFDLLKMSYHSDGSEIHKRTRFDREKKKHITVKLSLNKMG